MKRAFVAILAMTGMSVAAAQAQTNAGFVDSGIRAYGNLDYESAAEQLRRALADTTLDRPTHTRILVYLGAAEIFRERVDSAQAVFGRLLRVDPRYRIDRLIFPPEVSDVFEVARRQTRAVAVTVRDTAEFMIGVAGFTPVLYSSTFHDVRATIQRPDGSTAHTLYGGPLSDSLRLEWRGATSGGTPVAPGRYFLAVESLDRAERVVRIVRIPLQIDVARQDTLAHPAGPPDSSLLQERHPSGPGLEALSGLLMGVGVMALSSGLASGADLSESRLAIGTAISLAGIAGFLQKRPGRPIPANVAHNDSLRRTWRDRIAAVLQENDRRRADVRITVRAGTPQVIESDQ